MSQPLPNKVAIETLILAELRGFCAGVVRAIDIVEKALEVCGKPVYVRHEIIHNRFVVEDLRRKGAIFVEELDEVPPGSWLIFSAHGISPQVRAESAARKLKVIDATCPLVTKVHLEAIQYAKRGYTIILIGHIDHVETIGTMGEAPEAIKVVGNVLQAEKIQVPNPDRVAYLTQTTLSLDDTAEIVQVLKRRFPKLATPSKDDICYATQNRQNAVKSLVPKVDLLLVLGAPNSSNSIRLREVAEAKGTRSFLIESAKDIRQEWLKGVRTLGLTASASAPEVLVQEVVDYCRKELGVKKVIEDETVSENVHFSLPYELEQIIKEKHKIPPLQPKGIAPLAALALLCVLASNLGSESAKLVTSYPSPAGIYKNLTTTAKTILARDAGSVGIGTPNPASSALLDLNSTNRGFLPPRMNTTQRDAISSPAPGLMIFNTGAQVLEFFNGTVWEAMAASKPVVNFPARALNTSYTNTSGKNRFILMTGRGHEIALLTNGQRFGCSAPIVGGPGLCTATGYVRPGDSYEGRIWLNGAQQTTGLQGWVEMDF